MTKLTDQEVLESWHINAKPWIKAIENEEIESRKLVTNRAIIDAVTSLAPQDILDVGCGEGWLAGKLLQKGFNVFGIDAVPELIENARQVKGAEFGICTYENMANYEFPRNFDCLLCNFSLIGKESSEAVVAAAKKLLKANGKLVIQTLHPVVACGDLPYETGWREGSWAGFSADFSRPAPWYFRTLQSWCELFAKNGLSLQAIKEPVNPKTNRPASVIFICS